MMSSGDVFRRVMIGVTGLLFMTCSNTTLMHLTALFDMIYVPL